MTQERHQLLQDKKWEIISRILRIIEVVAVVGGVIFAALQIKDLRDDQSAQLMLRFNDSLNDPTNAAITTAVEDAKPLLIDQKGGFTSTQIDHYLSIYDLLNEVSETGLITDQMLYDGFSYDVVKTYQDKEIRDYLSSIRKEDSTLFAGFESLAISLEQAHN